jgi:predicted hotdog family 3-hydroxylacyl-ACP dehydratase
MRAFPSIESVLPHDRPMILIDEIVACDETSLVAAVTITDRSLFLEADGVPAYVGIEYMAQACGAYAGVRALAAGDPVRVGFLLGTRQYMAHVSCFRRDDRLTISVTMIYRDQEMGVFDCRIAVDGRLAAEAQLNVYQPATLPVAVSPP